MGSCSAPGRALSSGGGRKEGEATCFLSPGHGARPWMCHRQRVAEEVFSRWRWRGSPLGGPEGETARVAPPQAPSSPPRRLRAGGQLHWWQLHARPPSGLSYLGGAGCIRREGGVCPLPPWPLVLSPCLVARGR